MPLHFPLQPGHILFLANVLGHLTIQHHTGFGNAGSCFTRTPLFIIQVKSKHGPHRCLVRGCSVLRKFRLTRLCLAQVVGLLSAEFVFEALKDCAASALTRLRRTVCVRSSEGLRGLSSNEAATYVRRLSTVSCTGLLSAEFVFEALKDCAASALTRLRQFVFEALKDCAASALTRLRRTWSVLQDQSVALHSGDIAHSAAHFYPGSGYHLRILLENPPRFIYWKRH
ncbi:hypothetical protein VOLCADRAFT_101136 [Volvox carteri f. nagariensis]|uniref:Uncharacterized protein n=1 Tax=Volvox carteri f. nagariensis TaxID=3068 RepID=D8ULV1_VOLCA|nr:uncharacterized protein VOLCADRAFT_101136 [Volvox carteri f. nagariensis]EFJ39298.1 hypothetical protein VOLCADRAFT_101136 [Volvox carteri f. nagariensis]|eukprot:XP_002959637.1 hypothetical protein VOLCADRAFT_101136 [Volvox carteri f. nagariensis]